jgi:type VI secretion system secreted protein VgrG
MASRRWDGDMPAVLPDRSDALLSMTLDGDGAVLAPIRLHVRECISKPTEIELTAVHARAPFAAADILQKPAVVKISRDGVVREFKGVVRDYTPLPQDLRGFNACTLTIVPKLWGLSKKLDCRIFQEKTSKQIIEALLSDAGITGTAFRLSGADPALPYRAQYNEDCLTFATRIMEEAGWFYFFEGETLVITDANASLASLGPLPGEGALISGILKSVGIAGGKEKTADYDSTAPTKEVKGEQATKLKTTGPLSLESFRWPAGTDDPAVAAKRAKLRMEADEAKASLNTGDSQWCLLAAGHIFEVAGSDPFLPPGKHAVRSVLHQASDEVWLTGGSVPSYGNSFELFPEAVPWREPLATRRPRMDGVHAALVIGAQSDGDIFTDDMGRVKIRFFWDHRADATPEGGVWARVVQPWAGGGWGGQFIPRVGTEVAVAFMDGDPDRPVVLGGLYNGTQVAIFPKSEKMKSGFRTRSVDKGGASDFSEFSFDDKKGSEVVFLHAQKDLKIEVENDQNLKVDNCRIVQVKVDETITVKGKQSVTVKGDQTFVVEEGKHSFTVTKGDFVEAVDKGNYKTTVGTGNYDLGVSKGNIGVKADLGNMDLKAAAGAVTIEAAQSITLKVGANTIEIGPAGITIKGTMLTLKGTAMAEMGAPMTTVKGDGMLTLKGGITMIN